MKRASVQIGQLEPAVLGPIHSKLN